MVIRIKRIIYDVCFYAVLRVFLYLKVMFGVGLYAILLIAIYQLTYNFLVQGVKLEDKDNITLSLSLVTFLGGLLGGLVLDWAKKALWPPQIIIETWKDHAENSLKCRNGDSYFRLRIRNFSKRTPAQNCQVKISMDFDPVDVENVSFTAEECRTNWGTDIPFLVATEQHSCLLDEGVLWDIQPKGERILELDIPPQCSYLMTIARYRAIGSFFEIQSEHPVKPRIWLKVASDLSNKHTIKKYSMKIVVYGDNFVPASKIVELKFNAWDPVRCLSLETLRTQINVQRMAFPSRQ